MFKGINTFYGHIDIYLKNRVEDYTSQPLRIQVNPGKLNPELWVLFHGEIHEIAK